MSIDIEKPAYVPGACNIGPEEIQKRQRIGYIGTAMTILFIGIAGWYDFSSTWKYAIFAPIVYAVSGFIQARHKFCFLFGISGIARVSQEYLRIKEDKAKTADVWRALKIIGEIILISAAIALLYVFLS